MKSDLSLDEPMAASIHYDAEFSVPSKSEEV